MGTKVLVTSSAIRKSIYYFFLFLNLGLGKYTKILFCKKHKKYSPAKPILFLSFT